MVHDRTLTRAGVAVPGAGRGSDVFGGLLDLVAQLQTRWSQRENAWLPAQAMSNRLIGGLVPSLIVT